MENLTKEQAAQLHDLFSYHPATEEDKVAYNAVNDAAEHFAQTILEVCPRSADRSAAFRLIQDARGTANRSIANNGRAMPEGC